MHNIKKENKLVTIVTVTYNCKDLLEKTILSVINQTYDNVEYIIIDGASTDGTLDIIKKYEEHIDYWITEPDGGIYDAMNKGINNAKGEWINFMNAGDSFADLNTVEYVMNHNSKEAELIYGNFKIENTEEIRKAFNTDQWFLTMPFCHQTLFVKTNLMKSELFDTTYKLAADYNFIIKMYVQNKVFLYIDRLIAIFSPEGFASSNKILMNTESIRVLSENSVEVSKIEHSSWYKNIIRESNLVKEQREKSIKKSNFIIKQDKLIEEQKANIIKKSNFIKEQKIIIDKFKKEISDLMKISFFLNPIKKIKQYKKLIIVYQNKSEEKHVNSQNNIIFFIKRVIKKLIFYKKLKSIFYKTKTYFDKKRRVEGNYKYSVISAVYNVDKYLEDYFQSITNQTLMFEKHIHLIMVDDGSTDKSASIIKKWQTKYPDNIVYVKKENGGQASARNLGLEYVLGEWVGFIDPDDFLDYRYFEVVDNYLSNSNSDKIGLVSCNTIFYYEKGNRLADTHALKFRFKNNHRLVNPSSMEGCIQLSASSVLFKISLLKQSSIKFNEDIKPSFEDAHFVNKYILDNRQIDIVFLKKAKYLYRKRVDGTSTLDGSWKTVDKYINVLEKGYLDLLKYAYKKDGEVPLYIQRTILYELTWHFGLFVNNSHKLNHLTKEQKEKYLSLISEVFEFIDSLTIQNFELANIQKTHKIGWLAEYKSTKLTQLTCNIMDYDNIKNEIQINFIYHNFKSINYMLNDKNIKPKFDKIKTYDFIDNDFVYEKISWLPLSEIDKTLSIEIDNNKANIIFLGNNYGKSVKTIKIKEAFSKNRINYRQMPLKDMFYRFIIKNYPFVKRHEDTWLFIDRPTQADDNAEHLYRYILKNNPKLNIKFVLNKNSHDWDRLKKDKFNLIEYNSLEHKLAYVKAKYIISSHADLYVTDYLSKRYYSDIMKHKFIFLQHGVILHDLSTWLNHKKIDCFITSCPKEYQSISGDYTHYKFTTKEVVLTGLPRHDALISSSNKKKKSILIMPTWRQSLVGKSLEFRKNSRTINKEFSQTLYAKKWKSFLHSSKLEEISKEYGYEIIFFPHVNIQPYIEEFEIPKYITTLTHNSKSIQKLFQDSSLMVTDYSSVAFEMAYLRKPCLYYQFDYDDMFNGNHTSKKGYFNYEDDGFGPVCFNEDILIENIENICKDSIIIDNKYIKRMNNFFAFNDSNNCNRVFNTIVNLEKNKFYGD